MRLTKGSMGNQSHSARLLLRLLEHAHAMRMHKCRALRHDPEPSCLACTPPAPVPPLTPRPPTSSNPNMAVHPRPLAAHGRDLRVKTRTRACIQLDQDELDLR